MQQINYLFIIYYVMKLRICKFFLQQIIDLILIF